MSEKKLTKVWLVMLVGLFSIFYMMPDSNYSKNRCIQLAMECAR